eukprot:2331944-Pleurochrysis_carterae.AAC.1
MAVSFCCGREADGILGVGNEGVSPLAVGARGVGAGPPDVDVVRRGAHVYHKGGEAREMERPEGGRRAGTARRGAR